MMAEPPSPLEVSVHEAKVLLDQHPGQAQLIDVREPDEWHICHVSGARHIPMRQIPEQLDRLPRDQPLLLLCHHGGRSQRVTEYLRARGFTRASNVAGGIDAWAEQIEPGMRRY